MQLDELTQDRSIKTISKKTNLTLDVVQRLFNKEFETFNYPQAKGAIAIIEREFDMNLDVLSEECKYYFSQNPPEDKGVSVIQPIPEESSLIPKLITLFLLGVIAYGAWYFFIEYYNKQIIVPSSAANSAIEQTILQKDDTQPKKVEINIAKPIESKPVIKEPIEKIETNKSAKIEVIIEDNVTVTPILEPIIATDNSTVELQEITPKTNKLELIVPTVVETAVKRKIITLIPSENMWFRLINLDTKKRREYKRKAEYHIDMRENSWIFAAQNVNFSFKDKNKTAVYGGRGKLFYRLDQLGIHKLTQDEFRALEK